MAVRTKNIVLWRTEVTNRPGALADVLEPLRDARADLQILMGYSYPGESRAAIELSPVSGKEVVAAARKAKLKKFPVPTVLVEGDNRAGLGYSISQALGDAGINLGFLIVQVVGRKYSAVFGFESEADARRAAALIKKVAAPRKAPATRRRSKSRK